MRFDFFFHQLAVAIGIKLFKAVMRALVLTATMFTCRDGTACHDGKAKRRNQNRIFHSGFSIYKSVSVCPDPVFSPDGTAFTRGPTGSVAKKIFFCLAPAAALCDIATQGGFNAFAVNTT